jgi:hypothetical protein
MKKTSVFTLLGLVCWQWAAAQLLDTSDTHTYKPLQVSQVEESDIHMLTLDSTAIDTSVNLFYNYYAPYTANYPFVDQGLEGSAILPLASTHERSLNLNLGIHSMDPYFYSHAVHIYQTQRPFTRLGYSQGAEEMINMQISHGQQISERLAFGVDYRRLKNQNFYYSNISGIDRARMSNLFNTKFYTSYYSPDRKYEIITSYLWNKSRNIESGGMQSDSFFNSLSGRNKLQNNAANYTQAFSTQAQNSFKVSQYYRPGGKSTDSTFDHSLSQFNNQFFWTSELNYVRVEFEDENPDSANYGEKIPAFKDSLNQRTLSNEVGYVLAVRPFRLAVSLEHRWDKVYQNGALDQFQSIYANGTTNLTVKQFVIDAKVRLGLLGYNLGDYHLDGLAYSKFNIINVKAGVLSQLIEPSYTELARYSASGFWNNRYKKIATNQLHGDAQIDINQHHLGANMLFQTANGMIYYTAKDAINQSNDFVSLLKTTLRYAFENKRLGTDAQFIWQNSSNQQVLPRPATSASINAFGKFSLFKKKLKMQGGARTYWFSTFNSPMYNPYTRQWHNTNVAFDAYPPIQVYVNAKVKSFCFGVEFFHAQQSLMGTEFYSSPSYPTMPRAMRLNFRWDLNN